jgi:HEAT repeat protein
MTFLAENLGAPKGVELLAGPLSNTSAREVRVRAIEALGLLRAEKGIALATSAMNDPDFEVRNAAAMALGHIGDKESEGPLLTGLGETKGNHGWFCAEALGLIEDPGLFDAVLARFAGGGGGGQRAKALENCARPANIEGLIGLLQKGTTGEVRTAAANALGRLAGEDGGAPGPEGALRVKADLREQVADALLEGIATDREPAVRAASLWALRRCATASTGPKALKRIALVQGDDKILYLLTILGERKVAEASPLLLKSGILGAKQPMIRRAAGVAFWQVADADAQKEFKKRILEAQDFNGLERLCEALGSWRSKEGFDTAIQLLRSTREGSREQFAVMLALEKMTGHYFQPDAAMWNKWFGRNANFFTPKHDSLEREKWREEFDKENKGFRQTKETEKSVQMGLAWLARHQGFDGIWDSTGCLNHCDPRSPCSKAGGGRTQFSQAGTTGLPCLAFCGAGYTPAAGKHRHTIRRGLEALLATMTVEGDFDQADLLWNRSYARPIAMQALAEGYATTGDERYRRGAERILAREFSLMNERGGWRYSLQREVPEVDSSVSAWVVFAIKACEKAGIPVPRLLWEGPYMAFDVLTERVPQKGPYEDLPEDAGAYGTEVGKGKETYLFQSGYTDAKGGPSRATTPIGLMTRILLGWRRTHPFCIGSANYIVRNYLPSFDIFGEPGKEDWSKAGRFTPKSDWTMYNFYYCTIAMHQMGGKYFYDWNRRVSRAMPFFQKKEGCERGSWPGWNVDGQDGWVYATCMGTLTMETYYRYAPILSD